MKDNRAKDELGTFDRMGSTMLRVRRMVFYIAWTLALMPVQAIGLLLRRRWTPVTSGCVRW